MKILKSYEPAVKIIQEQFPSEYPTELLNEAWAYRIHGQSLDRLNQRGGMSPYEIYLNHY